MCSCILCTAPDMHPGHTLFRHMGYFPVSRKHNVRVFGTWVETEAPEEKHTFAHFKNMSVLETRFKNSNLVAECERAALNITDGH